jgi:sulfane dehydrogenase subunit SoxC
MLHGLVSNSEWTGIPLRLLFEEAGVKPEGKWVVAIGNDAPNLARSIPIEKIREDGLLALYQNGERVRPEQGYPMRLVLPGHEGNMNIKWVTSLQVVSAPAYTKDESGEYTDILADGKTLIFSFTMGVKSVITHPSCTMQISGPGLYEVSGLAWSGSGKVSKVEISADGGKSWADAMLAVSWRYRHRRSHHAADWTHSGLSQVSREVLALCNYAFRLHPSGHALYDAQASQ